MKKHWEVKMLGEVCDISTGKWDANHAVENGEFRFFTCAREPMLCNTKRFSGECLVLPGNGVNVGDVYYYKGDFDAYQRTYVISKIKPYPKYLFYHMLAFWKERNLNKQYGSATNFLKIGNFNEYEIPLPLLPEQKRIVGILDKAFAAISTAKANAEKNLQNARELFESYLQGVFANPGDGIEINRLTDCCDLIVDCEHKTAPVCEGVNTGYYSIRTPNIGKGKLLFENANQVIEETYKLWTQRAIPEAGDLIFAREAPAGNVAMIPAGIKVCLGQRTVLIRTSKNKLNSQFLVWLILAPRIQEILLHHSRGATVAHVNMKDIRNLSLNSIPPIKEQCRIVDRLDKLSAETKKLEAIYQQKLADLEELKKSILQKAFNGEL